MKTQKITLKYVTVSNLKNIEHALDGIYFVRDNNHFYMKEDGIVFELLSIQSIVKFNKMNHAENN